VGQRCSKGVSPPASHGPLHQRQMSQCPACTLLMQAMTAAARPLQHANWTTLH
jgi:hypothetical protein